MTFAPKPIPRSSSPETIAEVMNINFQLLSECVRRLETKTNQVNDLAKKKTSFNPTFGTITTTGGRIVNTTRVTTTYTILSTDHKVDGDTDGGAFTISLPAGIGGTEYKIANTGTSGNALTVAPNGSELLIGVNSNFTLNDGESLDLVYETTEGWA